MADHFLFSVLVPVYNAGVYLPECIESVLGQTDPDFELLLVDDGSTDQSGAVCEDYAARDARVRAFHQENGGQLSARVTALSHRRGQYCVFLDADDTLVPKALEALRAAIDASGADCVIYGIRWEKPGGTEHLTTPPEMCGKLLVDNIKSEVAEYHTAEEFKEYREKGYTIAFVSDMYLPSSILKEILFQKGCAEKDDAGVEDIEPDRR